ncbi:hypothetical protein FA10DRAFT_267972 [Acaromyces ingoldii]|uniref:BTB domain-containing protein n=1 Tax=Acaromyces ingoldii TaxID=215250 RepID=A0A316YJN8_9BASI|nr:hypothetical protein FA10DRAFT_267972 [Acaromyces ingoldii]PWN89402.1 hypothetical protein FA10DRAFT_267972 [Acaromyces ingoldii]
MDTRSTTKINGLAPLPRPAYAQAGDGEDLYVFGGAAAAGPASHTPQAGGDAVLRKLHVDEAGELDWQVVESTLEHSPGPRFGHSLSAFCLEGTLGKRHFLCCLGGTDESGRYRGEVDIFDVDAQTWLPLRAGFRATDAGEDFASLNEGIIDVKDIAPRIHHTATVVETDQGPMLFVVGGYSHANGITRVMGTLQILDLRLLRWSPRFELPQRYGHAAVLVKRQLLIVGGRDELGADVTPSESLSIAVDKVMLQWRRHDASGGLDTASIEDETYCESLGQHGQPPEDAYHGQLFAVKAREEAALIVGRSASGSDLAHLYSPQAGAWIQLDDDQPGTVGACEFLVSTTSLVVAICRLDDGDLGAVDRAAVRSPIQADLSVAFDGAVSSTVARDYEALLGSPAFCKDGRSPYTILPSDFVLQSTWPQAAPVHVHKLILLSRLPHFSSLLNSAMEEALLGIAKVDEPYEVVYALAAYLYTDRLPSYLTRQPLSTLSSLYSLAEESGSGPHLPSWHTALRLLHLSNLYTLPHLFQLTADVLLDNLTTHTAPYLFSAAALLSSVGPDGEGLARFSPSSSSSRCSPKGKGVAQRFLNDIVEWCAKRAILVLGRFEEIESQQHRSEHAEDDEQRDEEDDAEYLEPWARRAFIEDPRIAASLPSASKLQQGLPSIVVSPDQTSSAPSTPRSGDGSFSPFLAHVSAKLQLQADSSRRASVCLTPTKKKAFASAAHLPLGARSGRVTPSLGDLVGGRLSPSNASGRFVVKDLALDHLPLAF